MKFKELINKELSELHKLLRQKREELLKLRFKITQGEYKNVRKIRNTKKDIAKILTAINQKRLGINKK